MPLIFILDDDDDTLFAMEFWLKRNVYSVKSFRSAQQMLNGVKDTVPDIVLLDVNLKGEDGRAMCKYLKSEERLQKLVFLISTFVDGSNDYANYQADGFIKKPYHMKELAATLQGKGG